MNNQLNNKALWCTETLYNNWRQQLSIDNILIEEKTDHQNLIIFENKIFGRVLFLDGVIQVTQNDEFIYHEMMIHIPLIAHGNAEKVLIIGGGDGGILREVARHTYIKNICLVEIDQTVIDLSQKYLPFISNGSFNDQRLQIIIDDAAKFVKKTDQRFDIIICDSTDPFGPGEVLFTSEFYGNCKKILNEGGIFVNQNGTPFIQGDEITMTYIRRRPFFDEVAFYLAPIPTYIGGYMAFGWATDNKSYLQLSIKDLRNRMNKITGKMRYYTPEIHKSSFSLPIFVSELIPS